MTTLQLNDYLTIHCVYSLKYFYWLNQIIRKKKELLYCHCTLSGEA